MKLTTKQKTVGFFVVLLLAILFVLVIVIVIQKAVVGQKIRTELDRLGQENIGQIAVDVYNLCKISNDLLQQKVNGDLNVARYVLNRYGSVTLMKETVTWTAINNIQRKHRMSGCPKCLSAVNGWDKTGTCPFQHRSSMMSRDWWAEPVRFFSA